MTYTRIVITTISLLLPVGLSAQSPPQTATMSSHELHTLIKNAHSSAEYTHLAGYFRRQEAMYRTKAAEERAERDRRAHVNAALMQKYPRPVDSAQSLYERYSADADRAAAQYRYIRSACCNPG